MANNSVSGWKIKPLKEIAFIKGGKRLPKGSKLLDEPTAFPYIRVADFLDTGTVSTNDIKFLSKSDQQQIKNYIIRVDDLYISIAGTIGKTGIIPKELDGSNLTENAARLVYKDKNEVLNKYVYYYTLCAAFVEQAGIATKTVAQPKLALTRLSEILIPLPPLPEQHRIVAKLDSLFERTDQAIALVEQNIANAKHLMASVLNDAFDGLDCERVKLQEACNINPLKSEVKGLGNIEVSFLPMADLNARQIDFTPKQTKQITEVYTGYTYFKNGDVLLAKVTPCFENGKSGLASNLVNGIGFGSSEYYVLRANQAIVPEYLYYNITSSEFLQQGAQNMSGAVGLKRLTKDFLFNYEIPVPSIEVQRNVVKYFASQTTKLTQLNNMLEERMVELKALKSSLLDAAFKGHL